MIQLYDFEATDLLAPKATQIGMCRLAKDYSLIKSSCKENYINPEKPISWGAMGLNDITNEMVAGKPTFEEVLPKFKVHPSTKYIVCHNMSFDSRFFPEGFIPEGVKLLCTLKLAKRLIPKVECDNHKNATLYYYLGCYKNPFGKEYIDKTHTSLSDILMTANVLTSLLETFDITIDEAYVIANDVTTCQFSKHKGEKWEELVKVDYSYCEYLFNNVEWDNPDEKEYLEQLLKGNESIKEGQLKICSFKKYLNIPWKEVVAQDMSYVEWMLSKGNIKGDECSYVKGLLEEK